MTDGASRTAFRVLGPLEVWAGERQLTIGKGRQRTLLAILLMRVGDVVAVERLIDELWAADPPPSAAHALEAYVSRLRGALGELDVTIERRGAGYRLDLGSTRVDSEVFEELLAQIRDASARGEIAKAGAQARTALLLWRGDAYADVPFPAGAPSEAARLDELRLVAHEHEIDAALEAGENAQAIGELRGLVESAPYREGFVSRLMIALYRSGRQADALAAYEAYRRGLSDDLGLEPPPALQQLSGQIVRHEQHLTFPSSSSTHRVRSAPAHRRSLLAVGIAGLILIGVGVAASLNTSAPSRGPIRVGLVLPRHPPKAGKEDTYVTAFVNGFGWAKRHSHIWTTTIVAPEDGSTVPPQKLRRLDEAIRSNHLDLVVVAGGGASARALIAQSNQFPHTHFAIVDYAAPASALRGRKNVTALRLDDRQAGELAGFLAARMEQSTRETPRRISAIGGYRIPQTKALIAGYERGARLALPAIQVSVKYSNTFTNEATCERIANTQIAHHSGVVFAAAGTCGLGALTAAGIQRVWGIGADAEQPGFKNHLLASTIARFDLGVRLAVRRYEQGTLPGAKEVRLGLNSGAVGLTLSAAVPSAVAAKVAALDTQLRGHGATRP